jgi:hypothetical protein
VYAFDLNALIKEIKEIAMQYPYDTEQDREDEEDALRERYARYEQEADDAWSERGLDD